MKQTLFCTFLRFITLFHYDLKVFFCLLLFVCLVVKDFTVKTNQTLLCVIF